MNIRCGSLTDWMKEEIQQQNEYCGVDRWQKTGITGEGITVWNTEDFDDHGCQTHDRILDAAPNARVINAYISGTWNNDEIKSLKVIKSDWDGLQKTEYNIEDFIKLYKVKIVTSSISGGIAKKNNTPYSKLWEYLKEKYNLILFSVAGNQAIGKEFENEISITVQACKLDQEISKPTNENYSNLALDKANVFTDFRGWNVGTSFAAPYAAGKAALIVEKYHDITQEQLLNIMFNNCEYVSSGSSDEQVDGHRLFIMPNPKESFFEREKHENKEGAKVNEWSKEARIWAEANGIIKGDAKGDKQYQRAITREELITVLYRFKEYIKKAVK